MDKHFNLENDHPYKNQNDETHIEKSNDRKKSSFPHIFSGMIGGILSAVLIFFLITNDVISVNKEGNSTASAQEQNNIPISELINEDDDTSPTINELSKAIVGVINLRQRDIWTPHQEAGTGSGIIYKKENGKAYIVTNNHVVDGATEVEVELNEGKREKAKVLGTDALTDLAVLEIDSTNVEYVATLGTSEDLQIGETVMAIGNPISLEFSGTVTKGIVSGLNRALKVDTNGDGQPDWITEVIQTDAAINPGNSGGALVNREGKVVGINSMKIARNLVEGIGFAIPIDSALPIMEQLEEKGEVARPFIGISTVEINQVPFQYQQKIILPEDIEGGMVIADVQEDSPADKAGLQQFDIITKINDHPITSILDLRKYMYSEVSVQDKVRLEVYREGKKQIIELNLAE